MLVNSGEPKHLLDDDLILGLDGRTEDYALLDALQTIKTAAKNEQREINGNRDPLRQHHR